MEHIALGLLSIAIGALLFVLYRRDKELLAALYARIDALVERNQKLEAAQQARINYESLNRIDDGTSAVAVAIIRQAELQAIETAEHEAHMKRLCELSELLQASVDSFAAARNPKKGPKPPRSNQS